MMGQDFEDRKKKNTFNIDLKKKERTSVDKKGRTQLKPFPHTAYCDNTRLVRNRINAFTVKYGRAIQ